MSLLIISCVREPSRSQASLEQKSTASDTCDNPDADINCCFLNMPDSLSRKVVIADQNEPGERLVIKGTVFNADGRTPYSNVILYVYQTDNTGHYTKKGNESGAQKWHGRLHGWCKTDSQGRYEIHTIRPVPYPGNTIPAHIHCVVKVPGGKKPVYIHDFLFNDDTLVTKKYLANYSNLKGEGVLTLTRNTGGVLEGTRDITMKKND